MQRYPKALMWTSAVATYRRMWSHQPVRAKTTDRKSTARRATSVNLDRAKDLLATTVLTVAEVAEHAGFASVHYLSRVFRQVRNPVGVAGTGRV